jgi:hypothetical protein
MGMGVSYVPVTVEKKKGQDYKYFTPSAVIF